MPSPVSLKPNLFCTPQDCRELHQELKTSVIADHQLEVFIWRATTEIKSALMALYATTSLTTTPYAGLVTPHEDQNNATDPVVLYGVNAGASAYTEQWEIICGTGTFTVKGNRSGTVIAGGTYGATFAGTNGYITIPSYAWSGTATNGNKYYARTYNVYPVLVNLCIELASGFAFNSKYTEAVPNANSMGLELIRNARDKLRRMADPNASDGLVFDVSGGQDLDIEPIATPYQIDEYGDDITEYYPDTEDQEGETDID